MRRSLFATSGRRSGRRSSRGAAAVEFALISSIIFPVLFGLIDYGLWFSDSISARSGVREGVRRAVVQTAPSSSCQSDASYSTAFDKMRCQTKQEAAALSGKTYVMITTGANGWTKGQPLIACTMIKSTGVTGLVPLPSGRIIRSKTEMSIEMDTTKPTGANGTGVQSTADTLPSGFGGDWSWCS
jgi:Flp pilus assembly protein TadG